MPESRRGMAVAREWIAKAENDLKSAEHLLTMENCSTDTICFHAQQCVEKYLNARLVAQGTDFRKIHDLAELILLMPLAIRPSLDEKEQARLTEYATVTRYPGDYEPISSDEARQAVKIARRVRREVQQFLDQEPPFSEDRAGLHPE